MLVQKYESFDVVLYWDALDILPVDDILHVIGMIYD